MASINFSRKRTIIGRKELNLQNEIKIQNMILIAPDKFKGTLTATQVARIIDSELPGDCLMMPMADGGEGTAEAIASATPGWVQRNGYFVHPASATAAIDSSAVIGLGRVDVGHHDILSASSAPLGVAVREILKGGCKKVIIGVGGTSTCDGGLGFLEVLGLERLHEYRESLMALCDVKVPLTAPAGSPSALMFAPQKGAGSADLPILKSRLESIGRRWPHRRSEFDGAGGGLGFALASVIGCRACLGAEYILGLNDVDWDKISLVVTGEGRVDPQTARGKVVAVMQHAAARHNIPTVVFGGYVEPRLQSARVISTCDTPPARLSAGLAEENLRLAVRRAVAEGLL